MKSCIDPDRIRLRLRKVIGQIILEGYLRHCVRGGIEHGDPEKTPSGFAKALEHFSRVS